MKNLLLLELSKQPVKQRAKLLANGSSDLLFVISMTFGPSTP